MADFGDWRKMKIANLKIRIKLLLIYFFCVLIPIILTDATILYTVNHNFKTEKNKEKQFLMDRIAYNLNEIIEGCILFTNNIYLDRQLNDFLNKSYMNNSEYYREYMEFLEINNIAYNYNNGKLFKVQVYADNNTILNGGKISTIDTIEDTNWYRQFKDSGEDIQLYTYYDVMKRNATGSGTARTISIIRNMNNFGISGIEKVLKIDIDYNLMLKNVLNEKIDANIYVKNQDYILFSNDFSVHSMQPYPLADTISMYDNTLSKDFVTGRKTWTVVVRSQDTPFWTVAFENKGILLLVLLNIFMPSLLIYFVGKSISRRLFLVVSHMNRVKKGQFEEIEDYTGEDEIGEVILSYNLMVRKIRNLIDVVFKDKTEKQALELSKKQAELKAIQSQVNPHFLFNTLEAIRMRSLIKEEYETADIIGELAILFRKSMTWGNDNITIDEELSFVDKYINIQRYRFGDKLKYNKTVMEECRRYMIPKLTIVTFIENAFVHGIETSTKDGLISLTIKKDKNHLIIQVEDNGQGIEGEKLIELKQILSNADSMSLNNSSSTGVLNSFLRFKMYSEQEIIFDIDSEPDKGTRITIQLPLSKIVNAHQNTKDKGGRDND